MNDVVQALSGALMSNVGAVVALVAAAAVVECTMVLLPVVDDGRVAEVDRADRAALAWARSRWGAALRGWVRRGEDDTPGDQPDPGRPSNPASRRPAPGPVRGELPQGTTERLPSPDEPTEDDIEPESTEQAPPAPEVAQVPDPLRGPITGGYAALHLWDGTDKLPKLTPELVAMYDWVNGRPGAGRFLALDERYPLRPMVDEPSGSWPLVNAGGGS